LNAHLENTNAAIVTATAATLAGINATRQLIYGSALEVSRQYTERRADAALGRFSGLNMIVRARSGGRSIQIYWVMLHYRNGSRVGMTSVPKPKRAMHFDTATIKRKATEWLADIAVEAELEVRPLREALERLTNCERAFRVAATRLGAPLPGLSASDKDIADTDAERDEFPEDHEDEDDDGIEADHTPITFPGEDAQ